MKSYSISLLAALVLPTAVNANLKLRINEICMGAANYKGCADLNTEIVTLPKCSFSAKYSCTGELRYNNAYYVGEILNGKEHGFGTINWTNQDKYIGEWLNGKREGQGTYYWASGNKVYWRMAK